MALTYTQLSQALQDYTQTSEATFVSNIPNFVRQAEQAVYTSVQLPVTRNNQSGTLTAANRYLTTPTDFLAPYSLLVSSSGSTQSALLYKDVEWLREAYPDPTVTGVPKYYSMFDKTTFMVAKTPDQNYSVEVHYFRMPTSIVTASTTWLGDNYEAILLHGSLVFAYEFLKGEADMLQFYDAQFKQGISLLKRLEGMNRMDTFRTEQVRPKVA